MVTKSGGPFTGKIVVDLAISLDGFIEGASDQPERLHDWMFPPSGEVDAINARVIEESIQSIGAIIMGRRAYDLGEQYDGFVDTPYPVPHYIVTHKIPEKVAKGNTTLIFVTNGIESALAQAKAVAGAKNIAIGGGANISQQYLRSGLADEIELHVVPVLFGQGLRLFDHLGSDRIELDPIQVIETPFVTHLTYRVRKG